MGPGWSRFMVIWKVCMGLRKEGIRGGVTVAIGGWQWGRNEDGDGFPRRREQRTEGGVGMREGDDVGGNHGGRDGSPHPRGQRWEGRFPNRPYGLGHGGTLFTLVTENNKQGPKVPICWERA